MKKEMKSRDMKKRRETRREETKRQEPLHDAKYGTMRDLDRFRILSKTNPENFRNVSWKLICSPSVMVTANI